MSTMYRLVNNVTSDTSAVGYDTWQTVAGGIIYYAPNSWGEDTNPFQLELQEEIKLPPPKNMIHPQLYFSYVKSKLKKNERKFLEDQIGKLNEMLKNCQEIQQDGLKEELENRMFFVIQDWELLALGIDTYILKNDIEKFRYKIISNRSISFNKLEEFPREIPKDIRNKIKKYQNLDIFSEYWILYYDSATPVKTNETKIKEKDPIVFGTLESDPDRFYFIADWEDEYCDLTLDIFITKYKRKHKKYNPGKLEEFKREQFDNIIEKVKARQKRLKNTSSSTWKNLLKEEQESKNKQERGKTLLKRVKEKLNKG
jgi:hypothetical protein